MWPLARRKRMTDAGLSVGFPGAGYRRLRHAGGRRRRAFAGASEAGPTARGADNEPALRCSPNGKRGSVASRCHWPWRGTSACLR